MKNIFLLIATLFIGSNYCFGQVGDQDSWANMPDFAPKSPEAQAFQKYGDYNVNLAKGQVNVSVPLYTLEAGDYKLPIELSYNPSGIKVNQDATWVGLGWSLQAGAQITLDARDTPDETVDVAMPAIDYVNNYLNNEAEPWDYCASYMTILKNNSWIKDVYHFSSPTAQGKFILGDATGEENIHVYPPEAFKVETSGSKHARRFKITDAQGNIYFFNTTRETSKAVGVQYDTDYYTTAWYVDQIKTPANNTIDFAYTNDGWHARLNVNDQITISMTDQGCPDSPMPVQILSASQPHNSTTSTKTYKISSITYKDFRILFTPQTGRLDLATPSQLAQAQYPNQNVPPSYLRLVQIQNKVNGVYTYVKGYELQYSYFEAGGTGLEYYRKRLKLDAVTDMVDDNMATRFTYSSLTLPTKNSRQMDAWGYYNGQNNLTLVPPQHVFLNNGPITLGSANRGVNPAFLAAGMLTEIQYPSKGKTKFIYEPNKYYGVDQLTKSQEIILNSNFVQGTGTPGTDPIENPGIDYIPICAAPNPANCVVYHEIPFNITGTASAILTFDMEYTGGNILTINKYQYARVGVFTNGSLTPIYTSNKIKDSRSITAYVQLSGQGVILLEAYGQYMGVRNFQCKYTYIDNSQKNILGPGLRIASIENYADATTLAGKKQYTYTVPGQGDKSSGRLVFDAIRTFDPEQFRSFATTTCGVFGIFWTTGVTDVYRGQSPYFTMNEVYYTDVKEETVDVKNASDGGYTAYNFDFMPSSGSQEGSINVEYDWLRGNLLTKKVYKAGNKIVYEEVNDYDEDPAKVASLAGIKIYYRDSFVNCPNENTLPMYDIPYENMGYTYTIPWHYLKSKQVTETMYNASNAVNGTVVSTTTYNYNNPAHMQMTSQVTTSSKGETLETKYFYPGDSDVASEPLVSNLITANRLIPLKVQTFRNSVKLSETKKVFKDWSNGLIQPEIIQSSKGTAALETRLRFSAMDNANGNVLQVKQENGTDVSYIWGYGGIYPIAKIENATYLQVKTALGLTDDGVKALTEVPATIRTLLPNSLVTTYTYKPLVGLSSMTDPKGLVTKYEYDALGRLIRVKDKNNNLLSENQYLYKL